MIVDHANAGADTDADRTIVVAIAAAIFFIFISMMVGEIARSDRRRTRMKNY